MSRGAIVCPGARSGAALMALLMAGCGAEIEPTRFARGQKIPVGPLAITVSHTESVSADYFGALDPRIANSGGQLLAVMFDAEGIELLDVQRLTFDLMRMLDVVDDQQKKYGPGVPLPRRTFNMMMSGNTMRTPGDYKSFMGGFSTSNSLPTDWTSLFIVPEKSHGLTLRIWNLDHREGQPRLAVVPLGR